MTATTVRIFGLVQGVSFRYHAKKNAQRLNVHGWVRNRIDGSVEAFFQGSESNVNEMIQWCRHGPPSAFVEDFEVVQSKPEPDISGFSVRPSC